MADPIVTLPLFITRANRELMEFASWREVSSGTDQLGRNQTRPTFLLFLGAIAIQRFLALKSSWFAVVSESNPVELWRRGTNRAEKCVFVEAARSSMGFSVRSTEKGVADKSLVRVPGGQICKIALTTPLFVDCGQSDSRRLPILPCFEIKRSRTKPLFHQRRRHFQSTSISSWEPIQHHNIQKPDTRH